MSRPTQIAVYLALVIAGCTVLNVLVMRGGGMHNPAIQTLVIVMMWVPGLAAMLTTLLATRSLRGLGWRPGAPRYLLTGWVAPIVYGGIPFAVAVLIGAATFDTSQWGAMAAQLGFGFSGVLGVIVTVVLGTLISLASATGEEIGWRGFLVPALNEVFGFRRMLWMSGAIWTLYHLPLILFAGYDGGTPLWFGLTCFAAMVFAMTPMLAVLRLRSGSFWPTAVMHASHNLFIQIIFAAAIRPTAEARWLVGEFGIVTPVAVLAVVGVYFWRTGWPRQGEFAG